MWDWLGFCEWSRRSAIQHTGACRQLSVVLKLRPRGPFVRMRRERETSGKLSREIPPPSPPPSLDFNETLST